MMCRGKSEPSTGSTISVNGLFTGLVKKMWSGSMLAFLPCWANAVPARSAVAARSTNTRTKPPGAWLTFLAHHRLDAGAEILEHDHGCVAAGGAAHRAARIGARSGLIQPRDGHAVLRPARHGTHGTGLGGILRPSVRAAVPEVRIHALKINGALDEFSEKLVGREAGAEPPQLLEVGLCHLLLDFIPVLRALLNVIGIPGDQLEGVHAGRRAAGVGHGAANAVHGRVFSVDVAANVVQGYAQGALGRNQQAGFSGG